MKKLALVGLMAIFSSFAHAQEASAYREIQKIDDRLDALALSWRQDMAIINRLTNYKRTPVQEGTQAYYACCEASQRIQRAEAEAKVLKVRKGLLESSAGSLPDKRKPNASHSPGPEGGTAGEDHPQGSTKNANPVRKKPEPEKVPKSDAVKPPASAPSEPPATGRTPKAADSKSGKVSRPPPAQPPKPEERQTPKPVPAPVKASNYKPSGAGALQILLELRDPAPNQPDEVEFLEKRLDEVKVSLLAGLKKAVTLGQPLQDLAKANRELEEISKVLGASEKCAYSNSLDALTKQLAQTRSKFEEKAKTAQSGKAVYMQMLKDIGPLQIRVDALAARLAKLKDDVDELARNASEWLTIYKDALGLNGEPTARAALMGLLREKEMEWSHN